MVTVLDVHYDGNVAYGAAIRVADWSSDEIINTVRVPFDGVKPYKTGSFFKRELPILLKILEMSDWNDNVLVIDGYVTLRTGKSGLGGYLHEALDRKVAVVGIAKNPFAGNDSAIEVFRGESVRPVFVTSIGLPLDEAASKVAEMAGENRIPAIVKVVDHLARGIFD